MKKRNKYGVLGLKALKRAAHKVAVDAKKNTKIPVWKNGQIEFIVPDVEIKDEINK